MNKNISVLKITTAGILAVLAILSFLIENLFPPIIIPGARMGVSNLFILLSAILLGGTYGFAVLIVKILVGSLLSGNISSIMYSLPAGVLSLTIEILLLKATPRFSIIAVSVLGAVINTTIQNTVFCLITGSTEFFIYLPYLALIGIIGGLAVGFIVFFTIKALPVSVTEKLFDDKDTEE